MAGLSDRLEPGTDRRLGASVDLHGVNFALFSAHADRVDLCVGDAASERVERYELPERTGDIWHGFLPGAVLGMAYWYHVHGPNGAGHHFDPKISLLDPYALEWTGGLAQGRTPHCRIAALPDFGETKRLHTPWGQTIVYEAHVKGLSRQHPAIGAPLAGTYGALAHPAILDHLSKLGVTAIELLPVQAFNDEPFLLRKGLSNYWGYNPIGFFVADHRYAVQNPLKEFRAAVEALHEAGIEVILDVVYNHTGEGDLSGRTLSFRGIDNASYYMLDEDGAYLNDTGCGNTLDLSHPAVLRLAMDSLRFWVEVGGVDGFRFDLATTLGRDGREFSSGAAFLDCLRQDPVLAHVKLIAEPWDIGPGGYQLGAFGHPFAEWNDRFRDTVRRFWCQNDPVAPELAVGLLGSAPQFDHSGRRSWASVNFVTSHDGFTLADLVAYSAKRNDANQEDNRDGHDHNFSHNHGVEGPSADPVIETARLQTQKNLLAMLFLSQGTPMLLAGDEMANGQNGNNNAYCQDNPIGWLDWPDRSDDLCEFVAALAGLRREHPILAQDRFLHGETLANGAKNVAWRRPDGLEMTPSDWQDERLFALRLDLADSDERLAILLNGARSSTSFHVDDGTPLLATGRITQMASSWLLVPHSIAVVQLPFRAVALSNEG